MDEEKRREMKKSENFIKKDRALHADMLAALAEDRAEILYDSETTLLLREINSGVCFLSSEQPTETEPLLQTLYEKNSFVVLHGTALVPVAKKLGFEIDPPCRQVLYEGAPLCAEGELTIQHPKETDFALVKATYNLSGEERLRQDFDRPDFLGGYLDGKMVCFIGLHSEGSMGILEVLPEYRRRGYAQQIYCTLINNQLQKGRLPYAQIYIDNQNSLNLQKKLGFTFSGQTLQWSWNPHTRW